MIEKSRRVIGLPALTDELLRETTDLWAELVDDIPDDQLERCYRRAMRGRDRQGPLQPSELLTAWSALRGEKRYSAPAPVFDPVACEYCDGVGYQFVSLGSREFTRPCCCTAAPEAVRSSAPLKDPEYWKDPRGVWVRVIPAEEAK